MSGCSGPITALLAGSSGAVTVTGVEPGLAVVVADDAGAVRTG